MDIQAESHSLLTKGESAPVTPKTYEAPAVEAVVTLDEIEREIHYAGVGGGSNVAAA